jgi:hypothetical protein
LSNIAFTASERTEFPAEVLKKFENFSETTEWPWTKSVVSVSVFVFLKVLGFHRCSTESEGAKFSKILRNFQKTVDAVSLWTGANSATVHSFGIQREPSRPVGTAAEVVERVVRFVVRSTTD